MLLANKGQAATGYTKNALDGVSNAELNVLNMLNPNFTSSDEDFIEGLYNFLLGRPSDAEGKAGWLALSSSIANRYQVLDLFLNAAKANPNDAAAANASVANFIENIYQKYLGRPSDAGKAGWLGMADSGADLAWLLDSMLQAAGANGEAGYTITLSNTIIGTYENLLGRIPSSEEVLAWIDASLQAGLTPNTIAAVIADSASSDDALCLANKADFVGSYCDATTTCPQTLAKNASAAKITSQSQNAKELGQKAGDSEYNAEDPLTPDIPSTPITPSKPSIPVTPSKPSSTPSKPTPEPEPETTKQVLTFTDKEPGLDIAKGSKYNGKTLAEIDAEHAVYVNGVNTDIYIRDTGNPKVEDSNTINVFLSGLAHIYKDVVNPPEAKIAAYLGGSFNAKTDKIVASSSGFEFFDYNKDNLKEADTIYANTSGWIDLKSFTDKKIDLSLVDAKIKFDLNGSSSNTFNLSNNEAIKNPSSGDTIHIIQDMAMVVHTFTLSDASETIKFAEENIATPNPIVTTLENFTLGTDKIDTNGILASFGLNDSTNEGKKAKQINNSSDVNLGEQKVWFVDTAIEGISDFVTATTHDSTPGTAKSINDTYSYIIVDNTGDLYLFLTADGQIDDYSALVKFATLGLSDLDLNDVQSLFGEY